MTTPGRRTPTRQLDSPWPFRLSAVPGRGIVLNLPPPAPNPATTKKTKERK